MANVLLSKLREIDPTEFEHLIADLWEQMDYQVEVTQQSRDKGIDIRAVDQLGQKHLIQVKRHGPNTKIDQQKIQQYSSLYRQEDDVDKVYVITTNEFTVPAEEIAAEINVELVDSDRLVELINRVDKQKLVSKYFSESQSGGGRVTQENDSTPEDRRVAPDEIQPYVDLVNAYPRHSLFSVDLYLPGADLHMIDLSGADLSGADLRDADLGKANLRKTNLKNANLRKANLKNAELSLANLSGADFSSADLSNADLRDTDLCKANLCKADLESADFHLANLSDADLRDTNLRKAILHRANLEGANFEGANLEGANLKNANGSHSELL